MIDFLSSEAGYYYSMFSSLGIGVFVGRFGTKLISAFIAGYFLIKILKDVSYAVFRFTRFLYRGVIWCYRLLFERPKTPSDIDAKCD